VGSETEKKSLTTKGTENTKKKQKQKNIHYKRRTRENLSFALYVVLLFSFVFILPVME